MNLQVAIYSLASYSYRLIALNTMEHPLQNLIIINLATFLDLLMTGIIFLSRQLNLPPYS